MSRLLMLLAWASLVAVLVTHQPPPRDELPEWYMQTCAEVSTC